MALTILGANVSPFVRKVRIVLEEKGIPYTLELINPFNPPDGFLELSPLGRIPVLRDDDVAGGGTLPDSSVICGYLERKYPLPALVPADPFEHARALWFEEYVDTDFIGQAGPGIFLPVVLNQVFGKPADVSLAQKTCKEKLPRFLDYLEANIKGREFYVGEQMTIADIAVASPFINLRHAGYEVDAARWPSLAAFLARMHARPSFKKVYEEEKPVFHKPVALAS